MQKQPKKKCKHCNGWEDPDDLPKPKPVFLTANSIENALNLLNKRFPDSCFVVPLSIEDFFIREDK